MILCGNENHFASHAYFHLNIVYQLHRPAVCIKWSIQSHCGWFAWRGLLIVRAGLISFFTLTTCMWFPAYSLLDTCMHTRYIVRLLCPFFLSSMHLWTKTSVNTLKFSHIPSFYLIFHVYSIACAYRFPPFQPHNVFSPSSYGYFTPSLVILGFLFICMSIICNVFLWYIFLPNFQFSSSFPFFIIYAGILTLLS